MAAPALGRFSGFTLTAGLLGFLCALQLLCLWRAPAAWAPSDISVRLDPGQSVILGRHELAAPQADARHLALRRDASGAWWASNVSAGRHLILQQGAAERRAGSAALGPGQQFRIGAARFTVRAWSRSEAAFSTGTADWRYDGATLYRNGEAQPPCPGASPTARLAALWNRWAPAPLTLARPLTFGGNLYCDNRLAVSNLPGATARLARAQGALLLSSAASGDTVAPILVSSSSATFPLAQRAEPLAGVTGIVVGRTRLAVQAADGRITLRPISHHALFSEPRVQLPPQLEWRWRERQAWSLPAAPGWWVALGLACAFGLAAAVAWQRGAWPFVRGAGTTLRAASIATGLLAIAGIGALMAQRGAAAPGIGWSILLGCGALWCCLLLPGRLTLAAAAGILLLAVGLLAQLELGLGAGESSWLRHYQKTTALLAIGLGIGGHLRLRLAGRQALLPQTRLEWMLVLLAVAALAALLLQVVFGDETGVFDLQPVEFAKLALTALTAHCIAVGLGWHAALPEHRRPLLRWLRLAAPALLFAALLGLALVQVDDFSPLILLGVWSMAMGLAWACAARNYGAAAVLAGAGLAAAGAIVYLRSAGAGEVAQWGFYADRFLVWLDPATHPHTGQQLLLGARAIADGAWWGSDRLLGLASLGQQAGAVLRIPAVQDDFAPAFFLNRHGLLGGLALWTLQALFLVGLLHTAARSFAASGAARDFRQAWLYRFRCFALCGGAAFVLGHLLLAWGTNLAIFPIMGQPMSFLSAGGSHLLFFICPLLAFSAISAQSLEESESCRSTSNTRF